MGAVLLKNTAVVCLDPISLEQCDLRIADGRVIARASALDAAPDDEVIDLKGKLVFPGIVCAHTHLYSALSRGMPAPRQSPQNFYEILKYVWWRLDRALDDETIYWSAIAGGIDAIASGTTALIDHHASPGYIENSLSIVKQALSELGLRAVVCYETTDRGGMHERDLGLMENRRALESKDPLFRALIGAHAPFTLNSESLKLIGEMADEFNCGAHIHAAEDALDDEEARREYNMSLIDRLNGAGLLRPGTLLAHCTHLGGDDLKRVSDAGCWLLHNPRSNMNNSVGYARISEFNGQAALGTDGIGADMFDEAKFAFYKSRDAHRPLSAESIVGLLAGGQKLAGSIFKEDLQSLSVGAPADLTVLDYPSPTPLTDGNFAWHFIFGMSSAQVDSVMTAGKFLLRERRHQTIDANQAMEKARLAAQKLWKKMENL